MILAPLLLLVSAIIQPTLKSGELNQLVVIAGNLDDWYTSQAFALAALAVAVPAILGLMHMLRERQWHVGTVGGALALLGVVVWVAHPAVGVDVPGVSFVDSTEGATA
jgi:hypothetical protein